MSKNKVKITGEFRMIEADVSNYDMCGKYEITLRIAGIDDAVLYDELCRMCGNDVKITIKAKDSGRKYHGSTKRT